ncbi:Ribonuclease BN [Nitrospira sp. KM1]|nr:Ribonuclease BN [Nitrospira sp. KM1]
MIDAAGEWSLDRAPRMGAALAYYTTFAMVPLLLIAIAITGMVFGREASEGMILDHVSQLIGAQSTAAIKDMLRRADQPSSGILSTILSVGALLVGASGLFGELQDSLNTIWRIPPKEGGGLWGLIRDRFFSFLTVIGSGFLLLVSLILSVAVAALGKWFGHLLPFPEFLLETFNLLLSFSVITFLFALIFKILPDTTLAWRDVWLGAMISAGLFSIGKFAIGMYIGKTEVGSAYGAAGSLVIVLVWVYYSAQILLYGVELTKVYACKSGRYQIAKPGSGRGYATRYFPRRSSLSSSRAKSS